MVKSSSENVEVTIIMPCLNEEQTIKTCIDKAFKFLNFYDIGGEVLIVDNGSIDNITG